MYTRVLLACPLLGVLFSFRVSFIAGFTVWRDYKTKIGRTSLFLLPSTQGMQGIKEAGKEEGFFSFLPPNNVHTHARPGNEAMYIEEKEGRSNIPVLGIFSGSCIWRHTSYT